MEGVVCGCAMFFILMMLGLVVGGSRERGHFRDIAFREESNRDFVQSQIKTFPAAVPGKSPPQMIVAEVVIASDYLKTFLAGLRNFFGGEMGSYQTLLERARREAVLRVIEQARTLGYSAICNVRLQTADIGGGTSSQTRAAMAAIIASATAYHVQQVHEPIG